MAPGDMNFEGMAIHGPKLQLNPLLLVNESRMSCKEDGRKAALAVTDLAKSDLVRAAV